MGITLQIILLEEENKRAVLQVDICKAFNTVHRSAIPSGVGRGPGNCSEPEPDFKRVNHNSITPPLCISEDGNARALFTWVVAI